MPQQKQYGPQLSKAEERGIALVKAKKVGRVDIRGLAACLGISWPTAKILVEEGKILSMVFGKRRIIFYTELERYMIEGPACPPIPPKNRRHEYD